MAKQFPKFHFDSNNIAKTTKMSDRVSEEQIFRFGQTLISRRDQADNQLENYHLKFKQEIREHQSFFDKKLKHLLTERDMQALYRMTGGIDERAVHLQKLMDEVKFIEQQITSTGPTLSMMTRLKQAVEEIEVLKQEISSVTAGDLVQRLLDKEFDYLLQSGSISSRNSLLYQNSCGVKPQELQLETVTCKFAVNQSNTIFIKCPADCSLTILHHIRLEALNLNKKTIEHLPFQTFSSNFSMAFEFSPSECCQYQLSCFLYDVPIANSPMIVEGFISSRIDVNPLCKQDANNNSHNTAAMNASISSTLSTVGGHRYMGRLLDENEETEQESKCPVVNSNKLDVRREPRSDADGLNSQVPLLPIAQSTSGVHHYMGRLLDANEEIVNHQGKLKCRSTEEASYKLAALNEACSNERSKDWSRRGRAWHYDEIAPSKEDWDAESTSTMVGSFNETSSNVTTMGMTCSQRIRPDLTNMIKHGRGISAKLVFNIGQFGRRNPIETCFDMPIGCASNDTLRQYLVCDTKHNAVKLFDLEGRTKFIINSECSPEINFNRPSAVSVVENNNFVVKDTTNLYKFSPDGKLLDVYGSGLFKNLFGLAQDSQGVLMTLDLGHRREPPILYGIDSCTGKTLMQSEFAACRNVRNSKCYFMDCVGETFVVADLGASQAYICDPSGGLKQTFGGLERKRGEEGKFSEPSGVTMDAAANILIGDSRNDRVQIWSPSGEHLCDVKFNNRIFRPSNIYLTADGHLMVMNYIKNFVSVYKLEALR